MDKETKISRGLENFLTYLRSVSEQNQIAEMGCVESDAATQDILHALELWNYDRGTRARLARKLHDVRRERRIAKDRVLRSAPLVMWITSNAPIIKELERVLGEIRNIERKTENRIYVPRTHVMDGIGQLGEGTQHDE